MIHIQQSLYALPILMILIWETVVDEPWKDYLFNNKELLLWMHINEVYCKFITCTAWLVVKALLISHIIKCIQCDLIVERV